MSRIVDVEPLDCLAWKDGEHGTTFDDGVLWVLEKIGELPAVQPQRKTGEWIDDGTYGDYHPHHAWHCSECEESVIEIDTPWFKFCPNCGAYMRGDSE